MAINTALLKDSFEAIKPVAGEVVDHFYEVLFSDYPEAKQLFNLKSMPKQKAALIKSLVTVFENIDDDQKLQSYLKDLGGRHNHYGVEKEHYAWVGGSLLKTLKFFFDDTWTLELAQSWESVIALMAEGMQAGQEEALNNVVSIEDSKIEDKMSGENMKDQIETVLKELIGEAAVEISQSSEIRELVRTQAKELLKEVLQDELLQLREKWKQQKKAA